MLFRRQGKLDHIIVDFDGVRRKQQIRFPVIRKCSRCHRKIVIARVFGDPLNRFSMTARHVGKYHRHMVRDGFRAWLEGDHLEWGLSLWYLAERPTLVSLRDSSRK